MCGYNSSIEKMVAKLSGLAGKIVIIHHGDADGIIGAALLGNYLAERSCRITYHSTAEFGETELPRFVALAADCEHGIFVEAQGMPESYRVLSDKFINIDHHPSPRPPVISRTLNPWLHDITPLPAACYVIWDMLRVSGTPLPPATGWLAARPRQEAANGAPPLNNTGWLAALGSILDYCPDAARELIAREQPRLARFADLRDTFLAVQYAEPFAAGLAEYLATLPAPDELLVREPFAARRQKFRTLIAAARTGAAVSPRTVVARTVAGEFRLASPLANRLQDEFPNRLIVVIEEQPDRSRFSVRRRGGQIPVGATLARLAAELAAAGNGPADGTGHASAGSARVPRAQADNFLLSLLAVFLAG